jgi:hypothetical protein
MSQTAPNPQPQQAPQGIAADPRTVATAILPPPTDADAVRRQEAASRQQDDPLGSIPSATTQPAGQPAIKIEAIQPSVKITNKQEAEAYIDALAKGGHITAKSKETLLEKAAQITKQEDWDNLALVGEMAVQTKRPDRMEQLLENEEYGGMARIAQLSKFGAEYANKVFEAIDNGKFHLKDLPSLIKQLNVIIETKGLEAAQKQAVNVLAGIQKANNADEVARLLRSGGVAAVVNQMGTSGSSAAQVLSYNYGSAPSSKGSYAYYSGSGGSLAGTSQAPSSLSTVDAILDNPSTSPPGSIATIMKNLDSCLQVLGTAIQEERKRKDKDNDGTLDPASSGEWSGFVSNKVREELEKLVPGATGLSMNEVIGKLTMKGDTLGNDAAQEVRELLEKREQAVESAKELLELIRARNQKRQPSPGVVAD